MHTRRQREHAGNRLHGAGVPRQHAVGFLRSRTEALHGLRRHHGPEQTIDSIRGENNRAALAQGDHRALGQSRSLVFG